MPYKDLYVHANQVAVTKADGNGPVTLLGEVQAIHTIHAAEIKPTSITIGNFKLHVTTDPEQLIISKNGSPYLILK